MEKRSIASAGDIAVVGLSAKVESLSERVEGISESVSIALTVERKSKELLEAEGVAILATRLEAIAVAAAHLEEAVAARAKDQDNYVLAAAAACGAGIAIGAAVLLSWLLK